jgi:type II secretory pathway predicted ATPase ExeA
VRAPHHLGLSGARIIETRELQLAEQAVSDLVALDAMGVIYGPAGSGKTFAAALAATQTHSKPTRVQFPSRPTMLHVAQRLTRAITGALPPRHRNRFELSDELIDALSDQPRLVIVDEAQWLNRECIEYLRHLHDHPDTRFALLLVGGDGCWEVLSREPMLRSRIYRHVRFAPLDLRTVLEVIPRYHPVYTEVPAEVIAEVDERYAHGTFRNWASFTHSVVAHTRGTLTARTARDLLELHACSSGPAA